MLHLVFQYIVTALEVVGVSIILIGVIKMLATFISCVLKRMGVNKFIPQIRIELGNYLVLSLEVFIGRDIIETLLSPTLDDIIALVVLVFLRTLLAFFLNYEMTKMHGKELPRVFESSKKS